MPLAPDVVVLRADSPEQWQPSDPTLCSNRDESAPEEMVPHGDYGGLGPKLPGSAWRPTCTDDRFLRVTGLWPRSSTSTLSQPGACMQLALDAASGQQPIRSRISGSALACPQLQGR